MVIDMPTALLCRAKPLHPTETSDEWVYGYYYPGFGKVQYLLQVQKVPDDFWQYATDVDDWHRDVEMMVWVSIRPETLGRFTGVSDKNKKKIYEGDILEVVQPHHACTYNNMNGNVTYNDWVNKTKQQVIWRYGNNPGWQGLLVWEDGTLEVIGDVHSNLELLSLTV